MSVSPLNYCTLPFAGGEVDLGEEVWGDDPGASPRGDAEIMGAPFSGARHAASMGGPGARHAALTLTTPQFLDNPRILSVPGTQH